MKNKTTWGLNNTEITRSDQAFQFLNKYILLYPSFAI